MKNDKKINDKKKPNIEKVLLSLKPEILKLLDEMSDAEFQTRSAYITALILKEARQKGLYNDNSNL